MSSREAGSEESIARPGGRPEPRGGSPGAFAFVGEPALMLRRLALAMAMEPAPAGALLARLRRSSRRGRNDRA